MENNGGPAFPAHSSIGEILYYGMSLRDFFAGQALIGLINDPVSADQIAKTAYLFADAMLVAREAEAKDTTK